MIDALSALIISLLSFGAVISFVVTIHELGHYWVGRYFGVHAEAFSIGFGPKLWGWTDKNGTVWQISPIPLGGYVKFRGDANAASAPDRETLETLKAKHSQADTVLHFKPVWQRALIVAAGPFANFILAIALFGALGLASGERSFPAVVGAVMEDSAAHEAGFEPGDRIVEANGRTIADFTDITQMVLTRANQTMTFVVLRDGERITLTATPRREVRDDGLGGERARGLLGIQSSTDVDPIIRTVSLWEAPGYGVERTWETVNLIGDYISRLVTGRASVEYINGPIGIATTAGQIANTAINAEAPPEMEQPGTLERAWILLLSLLSLSAVLSVALGLMNLLPIPVLDGGHLMYYAYEAVAKQPPSPAIQAAGFRLGLALILGIMIVAAWNDLSYLGNLLS